jgi:hypothetical protein
LAATSGTVAGRPQPQTTAEPSGGPFVRHAVDGRRAMYVATPGSIANPAFIANPMVSSPGWNKGYRVLVSATGGTSTAAGTPTADAPYSYMQLVQMKDAFGTQLLTGPGFDIAFLVPMYSGQFGTDEMASPQNSPQFAPINTAATGGMNFQFGTYFPFEFAKAYGVISGANAALLPVLQINTSAGSAIFTGGTITAQPSANVTVDADFYWLPNVAADPPGIGTTCQWIFQPCNPNIPSAGSLLVQLPRLCGYLTGIAFDLRDASGARVVDVTTGPLLNGVGWPSRPKLLVDGVPLIDTLMSTWLEDLAISSQIGAFGAAAASASGGAGVLAATSGTAQVTRPNGTFWWSRKTGLAQRHFGLLDTGEIFLSTNPGTQIELAGFPWGTVASAPMTLNVIVGQVVPSGAIIRGLPEA